MNDYQKQLVQSSFRHVIPIADQAAVLFYDRLFALKPSLRSLFKGNIEQQGLKLMNTLQYTVASLDNLDEIVPSLQNLGRTHVKYGVEDAHYAIVGDALIWMLEEAIGEQFTEEVRAAWLETYSLISAVMREAAQEEAELAKLEAGGSLDSVR